MRIADVINAILPARVFDGGGQDEADLTVRMNVTRAAILESRAAHKIRSVVRAASTLVLCHQRILAQRS